MVELLAMYQAMPPLVVGLILFPVGLAVGSFSSVLLERIPRRQSIAGPRSHCPACGHTLGARELVPVLSFLWQRGKCRWCGSAISWSYPLLELLSGIVTAAASVWCGWAAGGLALLLWVAGVTLVASIERSWRRNGQASQSGYMLVEALVALLLITVGLAPVLDTIAVARSAHLAGQRRTLALGLAQARVSQLAKLAWTAADPETLLQNITCEAASDPDASCIITGTDLTGEVSLGDYRIVSMRVPGAGTDLVDVTVEVDCPNCKAQYGKAVPKVTLSATVRKGVWP